LPTELGGWRRVLRGSRFTASGLTRVANGPRFFDVPLADARVPDLVRVVQHGVVYTGGKGKSAEHGGSDPQDRHVPILVAGAGAGHGRVVRRHVSTAQIAPTILRMLGLDPRSLQAVRQEHTHVLPGTGRGHGH
jgi:arylsulfatase A-like enzyme